ncbi:carbonate dehydratase [Flocculibacter collagenilyticus]|uniref:carbonate dehydratase n=1 Tax=Flocculibacter collagenilyticus TaxID=2744479 RepID=UPI0018F2DDA8|nr:carbonate dehydratase [Flocculibacter collagenilyticus]
MCELDQLIQNNEKWIDKCTHDDPDFFKRLAGQQNPDYLWIGCSDSRVPANTIVGLEPGELFVHRNIANMVQQTDFNCLSVLQYAVEVLKVEHIIVCGHYGCGGVQAAIGNDEHGLVDNWLRQIKDTYHANQSEVDAMPTPEEKVNRMCELNVMEQVQNLAKTKVLQLAWQRGQKVSIHGLIYSIRNGKLNDLNVTIKGIEQVDPVYRVKETTRLTRPTVTPSENN